MSSRQRRVSAWWMENHYAKIMKSPLKGIITYGGGLNILEWIRDAEGKGFHATMTKECVELR